MSIWGEFKHGVHKAGHAIKDGADKAGDAIKHGAHDAEHQVDKVADTVADTVPELTDQIIEQIRKDLEALLQSGIEHKLLAVAKFVAPVKRVQKIGMFGLEIQVRQKIARISHYATNLPHSREDIVGMITDLSDGDVVDIHPLLIPGLPYVGVDPVIPIMVKDLVKHGDEILKHFGL